MKKLVLILVFFPLLSFSQKKSSAFDHVEPPFWWTGMKDSRLQILFHKAGLNLTDYSVEVNHSGVELVSIDRVTNPHYIFVNIEISPETPSGKIPITFRSGKKVLRYDYELKGRVKERPGIGGFSSADVIYLIMPDRFANGDPANDSIPGMYQGVNRARPGARHGGDLKGIRDHLDYIEDLGVTALWLNPILENNQRTASYHGYAITNLYEVDRRFGGNSEYVQFINACHARGLKVIQDMVMNHIGNGHWLFQDLPDKNWIHQFPEFTRSNYRTTVKSDPYAAKRDVTRMNDGWFDTTMPDVNQADPVFGQYLIQNTLWWIEYAGIDGIRMDTYPYPDKTFMANWAKRVMKEYPKFNIVGEVWIDDVATTAYWQHGASNADGYQSFLPSVTDFPLFFTVPQALNEKGGWDSGLVRLYNLLAKDFSYPDANGNVTFLDNHDVSRFFLLCGKDLRKYRMGMAFLLTTRGIPQLYYGSEILMDGDGAHHPQVRLDFPGGWVGDTTNAFTSKGRSASQEEAFQFLRTILRWRKYQDVIHSGQLTQYLPENNVYVYFRHNGARTVMVILNGNDKEVTLETSRFSENMNNTGSARDVLNDRIINKMDILQLPPVSPVILEWDNVGDTK